MVLLQLELASIKHKTSSYPYSGGCPPDMILSILIFIIQALRTLCKLSSYILIYICPWISQTHASLFSFLLCSCTVFFFHFLPILSSTVSETFFPSKLRCMELTLEAPFQQTYASLLFSRAKGFTLTCQLQNGAQCSAVQCIAGH